MSSSRSSQARAVPQAVAPQAVASQTVAPSTKPIAARAQGSSSTGETRRSLGDLSVGETAIVRHVGCARPTAVRLMEMGLLPGTRVTLVRLAPLGDPLELAIGGYALSIRRAEALLVGIDEAVTNAEVVENVGDVEPQAEAT